MRSPFLSHRIETLYLPYRVGVFAVCAATIIVASAVIWLACFIVERSADPFRHARRDRVTSNQINAISLNKGMMCTLAPAMEFNLLLLYFPFRQKPPQ
jgi:hypothetical protein